MSAITTQRRFIPVPTTPARAKRRPVRSLGALQIVDYADHQQQRPSGEQIECPECGKTFLGAAIVTDERPTWSHRHQTHFVLRRGFCDHGGKLFFWRQACSSNGERLGVVLDKPSIVSDPKIIQQFLAAHPEACGVLQR